MYRAGWSDVCRRSCPAMAPLIGEELHTSPTLLDLNVEKHAQTASRKLAATDNPSRVAGKSEWSPKGWLTMVHFYFSGSSRGAGECSAAMQSRRRRRTQSTILG